MSVEVKGARCLFAQEFDQGLWFLYLYGFRLFSFCLLMREYLAKAENNF